MSRAEEIVTVVAAVSSICANVQRAIRPASDVPISRARTVVVTHAPEVYLKSPFFCLCLWDYSIQSETFTDTNDSFHFPLHLGSSLACVFPL